ncbi:MAG TPA: pYEATS domain-containing protein [Vicinamibacterales bacterium]|nr:pYEATS domain-containing protein [Vicinamibacterales bacterium]
MAVAIKQDATYAGSDSWQWSVWLDGPPEELDAIDHVTYVLHSTFLNPVREIHDRTTNFRLETSGWGRFRIHAKATYKDGHQLQLQDDLVLLYPDGTPTTA